MFKNNIGAAYDKAGADELVFLDITASSDNRSTVADMVRNGDLSPGHARALISIDDKDYLITLAKQACDNKLTVREIENRVRLYFTRKAIPGGPRKEREVSVELKEMVSDMKRIFATKVKLLGNDKKGRIIIDYFSEDDIDRIHALVQILKMNEKL